MKWIAPCISDANLSAFSLSFPTTSHYVCSSQSSRAIFTGEVINSNRKYICEAFHPFGPFIAEKMFFSRPPQHSHMLRRYLLQLIHAVTLFSPCLSAFASLNVWYIKPTVFTPFLSFRHNSPPSKRARTQFAHGWVFFNLLLHVQTHAEFMPGGRRSSL